MAIVPPTSESADPRARAIYSLRHARGRYSAERAAQLSGIPKSTLYDWNRAEIYTPDYSGGDPMAWSYRDLVYVRVLAWLRSLGMPRPEASLRVQQLKQAVASGTEVYEIRADDKSFIPDDDASAPFGGQTVLLPDMLRRFDLVGSAVEEFGRNRLWGPDLVAPSERTYISPWVLGGDPCVENTRIPTAAIFSLRSERRLTAADVIALYPDLSEDEIDDAETLERRLHGLEAAA